jgi:amidase
LARYVEDLALALKILAGVDLRDPSTFPVDVLDENAYRKVDLATLRIAYYLDDELAPTLPEVKKAVSNAVAQLRSVAANVQPAKPPGVGKQETLTHGKALYDMDYEVCLRRELKELGTHRLHPVTQNALSIREPVDATQRAKAFAWWNRYRVRIREFLTHDFDAIVCPVYTEAAPKHGETLGKPESLLHVAYYSIAQTPAAVVRCGTTSDGLPVGVQIVANHWREDIALAVAAYLEETLGGWNPSPILPNAAAHVKG